jgi:hypothetical protein
MQCCGVQNPSQVLLRDWSEAVGAYRVPLPDPGKVVAISDARRVACMVRMLGRPSTLIADL